VLNKHREIIYARRREVLEAFANEPEKLRDRILDIIEPTSKTIDALKKLDLPAGVDVEIK